MKKLLLLLSLCGLVGLEAANEAANNDVYEAGADVQEMIWVKPSDSDKPMQVPKGLFSTLDNLVDDVDGNTITQESSIPLPNIDSIHLKHAINLVRGTNNQGRKYYLPVMYENLKRNNITLEKLLNTLNFLGENALSKIYVAWLNHPENLKAAVHEGASAEVILNQMGLDTNKINESAFAKVFADPQYYIDNVVGYQDRQSDLRPSNIQNLIENNLINNTIQSGDNPTYKRTTYFEADVDFWPLKFIYIPMPGACLHYPTIDEPWCSEEIAPSLTSLDGLENIPQQDKDGIVHFNLEWQPISTLKPNTFRGFNHLMEIVIIGCKYLHSISPGAFNGLDKMRHLEIFNSGLKTISQRSFEGMPNLKNLWLSYNRIEFISDGAFQSLVNLKGLYLEKNKIDHLSSALFTGLNNIEEINLSNNALTSIERDTFRNLTTLKKIVLDRTAKIEELMEIVELPDGCEINWLDQN